jgi:hypothetical protein
MAALAKRLRLANVEARRLTGWAMAQPVPAMTTDQDLTRALYRGESQGITDRLRLSLASARRRAAEETDALMEAGGYARLLKAASDWTKPVIPIKGDDLKALGVREGAELGKLFKQLETEWVESGFSLPRDALIERARVLTKL